MVSPVERIKRREGQKDRATENDMTRLVVFAAQFSCALSDLSNIHG